MKGSLMSNLMRLISIIILAILPSVTQAQRQAQELLRVVTRMMPPLVLNEQGQLSGFSIDLWNSIAQRMQAKTRYHVARDVGALLEHVHSGKADVGIAAVSITPTRKDQFDFSEPLLDFGLQIMVRSADQRGIDGSEDLPGKRVAATRGSTSAVFLRKIRADVHVFTNIRSVYDALMDKKVDAVVFDAPVLLYYAANEGRGRVAISGPVFHKENYGIVFPKNSLLSKDVNEALLALRQDGTYQQLYDKWFANERIDPR
jgi:glutamine transport system substrate-binding protein